MLSYYQRTGIQLYVEVDISAPQACVAINKEKNISTDRGDREKNKKSDKEKLKKHNK